MSEEELSFEANSSGRDGMSACSNPGIAPLAQIFPDSDSESIINLVTEAAPSCSPCATKTPSPGGVYHGSFPAYLLGANRVESAESRTGAKIQPVGGKGGGDFSVPQHWGRMRTRNEKGQMEIDFLAADCM